MTSVDAGEQPILIFLHIPKTGGQTLTEILDQVYAPEKIYTIDYADPARALDGFRNMPPEKRAGYSLIRGHAAFGLHKILPRPARYITFLRDPVERAASLYAHILRDPGHYLHEQVRTMSFCEFATSSLTAEMDNGQARLLTGFNASPSGQRPPDLEERAIAAMRDHFLFVGLTERYDESLLLLAKRLRWRRLPGCRPLNVNPNPIAATSLLSEEIAKIEAFNSIDRKVYLHARDNFEIAIRHAGPLHNLRLRFYRMRNRRLAKAVRFPQATARD